MIHPSPVPWLALLLAARTAERVCLCFRSPIPWSQWFVGLGFVASSPPTAGHRVGPKPSVRGSWESPRANFKDYLAVNAGGPRGCSCKAAVGSATPQPSPNRRERTVLAGHHRKRSARLGGWTELWQGWRDPDAGCAESVKRAAYRTGAHPHGDEVGLIPSDPKGGVHAGPPWNGRTGNGASVFSNRGVSGFFFGVARNPDGLSVTRIGLPIKEIGGACEDGGARAGPPIRPHGRPLLVLLPGRKQMEQLGMPPTSEGCRLGGPGGLVASTPSGGRGPRPPGGGMSAIERQANGAASTEDNLKRRIRQATGGELFPAPPMRMPWQGQSIAG